MPEYECPIVKYDRKNPVYPDVAYKSAQNHFLK